MHSRSIAVMVLAYIGFISLGLPDGVYGVAWPRIRMDFAIPQSGFGLLLAWGGAGYFLSSFATGKLLRRMHVGNLLVVSTTAVSFGVLGFGVVGHWLLFLACTFIIGTGSGAIDGALNSYASRNFSPRHITWLHGCYGIGAAAGPALMTHAIARVGSWRTGYLELACILGGLTIVFFSAQSVWDTAKPLPINTTCPAAASLRAAISDHRVLRGSLTFFVYTGLESTVGQWNFTVNTEGRGGDIAWAGTVTVLFWASLTAGRFLMGSVVTRVGQRRVLAFSLGIIITGVTLFALPSVVVSAAGLILAGFGMATIYPLLMAATPGRVGPNFTDYAVGLQVSSATLGIMIMPSLAGVLAQYAGLATIPPFAIGLALALIALHYKLF